jgi:uncharacterized membrane protein
MLLLGVYAWVQLPAGEQIPVHWNAAGEADRYGGKFEGLLLMPLIGAGVIALLAVIPRIDPKRINIERSGKAYGMTMIGTILFLTLLYVTTTLTTLGYPLSLNRILPIGMGVMFMIIGNYMGKVRQNYMFGIRTPWTIASELSWNKTHRMGGWAFFVFGLLFTLFGLFSGSSAWIMPFIASLMVLIGGLTVYSYLIWRNDPEIVRE